MAQQVNPVAKLLIVIIVISVTVNVILLENNRGLNRKVFIYEQLAYEFNAELDLNEEFDLDIDYVDMIDHFRYNVVLTNGTILKAVKTDVWNLEVIE
jgi:hypothetical protein